MLRRKAIHAAINLMRFVQFPVGQLNLQHPLLCHARPKSQLRTATRGSDFRLIAFPRRPFRYRDKSGGLNLSFSARCSEQTCYAVDC
jgi:hypothetical protein